MRLTAKEKKAVLDLGRLARCWPKNSDGGDPNLDDPS